MPETASRVDPFLAFRFEVEVDTFPTSGFSECSGLQLETEVQDYSEGGLNTFTLKFPGRTKQTNLQFKRGVVDRKLWDWYFDLTQGKIVLRSGSIRIMDQPGTKAVMEFQFRNAFPCKWVGPGLNATQSSIAVEILEICHQGLSRIT